MQLKDFDSLSDLIDSIDKHELVLNLKDIVFEHNYSDIIKSQITLKSGEEVLMIDTHTLLLRSKQCDQMVLVECSNKPGEVGVQFNFKNAYRQEVALKYLLSEYSVTEYTITNTIGGRSPKYGEMILVDPNGYRFFHDQADFNKIGYILRQKVEPSQN